MTIKLDRIELDNFKSYHGKHVVGPFKGFTSVIGPNGCGKSNLMDAISFVLGDTAPNLRVTSLSGVIHNCVSDDNSHNETATVSAYFTNSTETHIYERLVGKGGKCEYRVNGDIVTAKTYQESLEELGIVLKARNFLVFQGGIESIALQNPKERARMFDRISGSYKLKENYDQLKQKFQKSLEHAHQVISLKRGIMAEKNQAKYEKEEAQKYQDYVNLQKSMTIQLYLFKLYHIDLEIKQHRENMISDKSKLTNNLNDLNNLSTEISIKKNEYISCSKEKSSIQLELQDKKNQFELIKTKTNELDHTSVNLKQLCQELNLKLSQLDTTYSEQMKELETLEKELTYTKKCRENYNNEHFVQASIYEAYSQAADLEYQDLIESFNKVNAISLEELNKLNEAYSLITQNYTSIEQKINLNARLTDHLSRKLDHMNEKKQKIEAFINENSEKTLSFESTIEMKRTEHSTNAINLIKFQQELDIINDEICNAKFSINENLQSERNFELTLSLKKNFTGVLGRLVDLCHPSHKKYSISITKVTQRYMDAFVVNNEITARECIQFLKDRHEPPCLFLPIDSLCSVTINAKYRDLGGTAKLLVDVIKYELPQMKRIIEFVCGNTIVCDTLEEGKRVAFHSHRESRKVVTLEGTLFLKSGVISGGIADISGKASKWDQKQLTTLKSKRDILTNKIHSFESVSSHSELHQLSTELMQLKNRIEMARQQLKNYDDLLISDIGQQLTATTNENEELNTELSEILQEKAKMETQTNQMSDRLNTIKDKHFRDFNVKYNYDTILDFEKAYVVCRSTIKAQKLKYDMEIEQLEAKIDNLRNSSLLYQIKLNCENLTAKTKALEQMGEEIKSSKHTLNELRLDIDSLEEKVSGLVKLSNELDLQLRQLTAENIEKKKLVEILKRNALRYKDNLSEILSMKHHILKNAKIENITIPTRDSNENELIISQLSQEIENELDVMLSQLNVDNSDIDPVNFKVDYHSLPKELKMDSNDNIERNQMEMKLQLKIDNFKKEMSRLNKPNMKSFDRLEHIMDKLKLTDQEIEKCRQNARKAKIDFEVCRKERTKLFMDTFENVAQCIDLIYKLLTGSPRAQAYLSVDLIDEPYLGSVNFNSIVPGKKYRPMDNLSGGEKTIASLALLFAIHHHKPSPFFILDEIDAALDSSNIEKVANYIQKKSSEENMQFIVISLKEDLYSAGDAAIGVTSRANSNHIQSCLFTLDLTQF